MVIGGASEARLQGAMSRVVNDLRGVILVPEVGHWVQQEAPERQNGTVVAPVERSGKKSRTVRLTRTQVALAKRLGLSNEQYAAQLMKEQSNG